MNEITLTEDNFTKEVLQSDIPVLVDFWAPWCGPCKAQNPILSEFAKEMRSKEMRSKVKVAKVNVDENQELASQYGVMSIPTLIWFYKGKAVSQMLGVQSKERLGEEAKKF